MPPERRLTLGLLECLPYYDSHLSDSRGIPGPTERPINRVISPELFKSAASSAGHGFAALTQTDFEFSR